MVKIAISIPPTVGIAIGTIIHDTMKNLDLRYPKAEDPELLEEARKLLMKE